MSKVDEILSKFAIQILGTHTGATAFGTDGFNAKQALYTDLLELIGEDEPGKSTALIGSEFSTPRDYKRTACNQLRQELRDKLKEYFGITE